MTPPPTTRPAPPRVPDCPIFTVQPPDPSLWGVHPEDLATWKLAGEAPIIQG